MSTTAKAAAPKKQGRLRLIRDVGVFQVKLFLDGLRDLILSPISLLMGIIDVFAGTDRFYRLLALGKRTELWINLFDRDDASGLDEQVRNIETIVANQYQTNNTNQNRDTDA